MTTTRRTTVRPRRGAPATTSVAVATAPSIEGRLPGTTNLLRGALFGPPKTGKTTLATSGRDVLLMQFDPGGDASTTLQGRQDITVVEPKTYREIEEIIKALATTDAERFKFVAVDSVTFLFHLLGGKEITDTYRNNKDIRRAYGKPGAEVSSIIHDMLHLNMHVIFTAHLQKEDHEDGTVAQETAMGEHEVRLAVTPMVWKILGPGVGFIGRTFKKTGNSGTTYHVSFNDGDRSPAGARIAMPGELEITGTTLQDLADKPKEA